MTNENTSFISEKSRWQPQHHNIILQYIEVLSNKYSKLYDKVVLKSTAFNVVS